MPKIRGVKPDLWTDENFVELSPYARLLWIGLWNFACDNGHLQDKSKQIKMRVLPTDEVNCAELLREIASQRLIERADGWITIPNLSHHQKPHKRWFVVCEKPGCEFPEGSTYGYSKRDSTVEQPLNNGGPTVDQPSINGGSTADVDGDVDVDCEVDGDGEGRDATPRKRAIKLPANWKPTADHQARALAADLVLGREVDKFRAHAAEKGRTAKNWNAAFTRWLMNAEEYASRGRAAPTTTDLPLSHKIEEPPPGLDAQAYDAWYREQHAKRKAAG